MNKIALIFLFCSLVVCCKKNSQIALIPFSPPKCGPVYSDTFSFIDHSGVTLIKCEQNTEWSLGINDTTITGNDTIGHFTLYLYYKDNFSNDFNIKLGEEQVITWMSTSWKIKWLNVYSDTIRSYGDPLFPVNTPLLTWGVSVQANFSK